MIINLLNSRYRIWWILFHIALGAAAVLSNAYIIVWFYFTIAGAFYLLAIPGINKPLLLACAMTYIGAFELLARMTKCSPIIPWEASKYLFTIFSIIGILLAANSSKKQFAGALIIILLLPGIFLEKTGLVSFNEVIFNVLGVVNIGLGMIFFSSLNVKKHRFFDMIRLMAYPCIAILTFTIIKTPDLQEINFLLGAQTSTSGDFGSNQVSTVLGLGFLLMSISWIMNWKITTYRITDGLLASLFLIQGLFTFSRGGMIGGGLSLLVFLYFLLYKTGRRVEIPANVKKFAVPALVVFFAAILFANNLTGGKLLLRYLGETEGTLLGSKERDLSTMTTSRNLIFLSDLELWKESPVLGSGAGSSKYLRAEGQGIAAHIELSRLLAEHGLPGLIIFLLILYSGLSYFKEKDPVVKALKISLFLLAVFTTFHSATRTFVTPLLLSLCALNIGTVKKIHDPLPRK